MKKRDLNLIVGIFIIGIFLSFVSADAILPAATTSVPSYNYNTNPQTSSYNGVGTYSSSFSGTSSLTNNYYGSTNNLQYTSPSFSQYYTSDQISTYWPILSQMQDGKCDQRSDFLIQIAPTGCTPTVVRSDLLEEQNVPVFCPLSAIKINPLIKVSSISAISFKGNYSSAVAGISFHPARAAVRTYQTLLGSPLMNDIGYVVIILKQNKVEKTMPEWVSGNLTATIQYDAEQAFGAGQSNFYIPVTGDENWSSQYQNYGFFNGKGFVRVTDIQNGTAHVQLYSDKDHMFREFVLNVGQTSDPVYFPGFYCLAALQVKLNGVVAPERQAQLNIDGNNIWVRQGSRILNNRCSVGQLSALDDGTGSVSISCPQGTLNLLKQRAGAVFLIGDSGSQVSKNTGDILASNNSLNYYLANVGTLPKNVVNDAGQTLGGQRFALAIGSPRQLTDNDFVNIAARISQLSQNTNSYSTSSSSIKLSDFVRQISLGNSAFILFEGSSQDMGGTMVILQTPEAIADTIVDTSNPNRRLLDGYFDKSNSSVASLLVNYPLEKSADGMTSFGEQALLDEINLAKEVGRINDLRNLAKIFTERYPNSGSFYYVSNLYASISNYDIGKAYQSIVIDGNYHTIGVDSFKNPDLTMKSVNLRIGSIHSDSVQEGCRVYLNSGRIDCSIYGATGTSAMTFQGSTIVKENNLWTVNLGAGGKYHINSNNNLFYYSNNNWVGIDPNIPSQVSSKTDDEKAWLVSLKSALISAKNSGNGVSGVGSNGDYVSVLKIEPAGVTLDYVYGDTRNTNPSLQTEHLRSLKQGEYVERGSPLRAIYVDQINVQSIADISILPRVDNTQSEANFTFKVGIEKRSIKLSTEKTQEMINNLNNTIKKWDDINSKLGNVISAWKGVCFATAGVLMAKNLVSGFSGETMARQQVMKAYRADCASQVGVGKKYQSDTQCYNAVSSQINSDVAAYTKAIESTNSQIEKVQESHTKSSGGLLDGSYVETSAAMNDYKNQLGANNVVPITINGQANSDIKVSDLTSFDQLRAYDTYNKLKGSGASQTLINSAQQNLNSQVMSTYKQIRAAKLSDSVKADFKSDFSKPDSVGVQVLGEENLKQASYSGQKISDLSASGKNGDIAGLAANTPIQVVSYKNQEFLVTLKQSGGANNALSVDKIYQKTFSGYKEVNDVNFPNAVDGAQQNLVLNAANDIKNQYAFVVSGSCKNKYTNAKVQYYENSPSSKLPAIVPFDLDGGWYTKVPNTVNSIASSLQQGYTAAGDVSFFYICNVGSNGLEENTGGDDICQSFDVNSYANVKSFSGCSISGSEVQNLAQKAREAIRQASQQYGKNPVSIFGKSIQVAQPMTESVSECQDFMSPEDCKVLFNVCDPVICPSSRCNLGGAYPNSDVVQTGIIGSILLCLPNIKEGVVVPVCLTGIHAGIENFISILKSERECLVTSLETGQHVGICDEITSVYMCEFFWRQLAPVMNLIIPKMIETAYGQGARGGGEYLTVMHSWDSLQSSISYFKDSYAQNAFSAFQVRSVEEAGGTFCKAFIGTSIPTNWDALLAPESPMQIYAWFSEFSYTGATVPATSQYKIYYHIYAGKDQGVQYQVYLKNPPASSYYNQNQMVVVGSGYIGQGKEADKTIDFTAPAGYKELCINYNGQEKCGFKQVTTDFALNYLNDKYVAEQANKSNINSEKTCISGSPSALPMVNPNLEAGVQNSVQPSIAMNGIVRVCATNNPGASTDPSRWQNVGNCGSETLLCWLDSNSVKSSVNQVNAIDNNIANSLSQTSNVNTNTPEGTRALIDSARIKISGLNDINSGAFKQGNLKAQGNDIVAYEMVISSYIETKINPAIADLDNVTQLGYSNADKAEALMLKAQVYAIVTRALKADFFSSLTTNIVSTSTSGSSSSQTSSTSSSSIPTSAVAKGIIASSGKQPFWDTVGDFDIRLENNDSNTYGIDSSNNLYWWNSTDWVEVDYAHDSWKSQLRQELISARDSSGQVSFLTKVGNAFSSDSTYTVKDGGEYLKNIVDFKKCSLQKIRDANPPSAYLGYDGAKLPTGYQFVIPGGCAKS